MHLQKWQCVEDASGKLKLHKCKGPVRLGSSSDKPFSNLVPKYYGQGSKACTCERSDYKLGLAGRRKKLFKKSKCHSLSRTGQEATCLEVPFVQTIPKVFASLTRCHCRNQRQCQTPLKPLSPVETAVNLHPSSATKKWGRGRAKVRCDFKGPSSGLSMSYRG